MSNIFDAVTVAPSELRASDQTPLGRILLGEDQRMALGKLLGIDATGQTTGYLIGTLVARVDAMNNGPNAVEIAGKPDHLRALAGVADDADAADVFRGLIAKYQPPTAQRKAQLLALSRGETGDAVSTPRKETTTPQRKRKLLALAGL